VARGVDVAEDDDDFSEVDFVELDSDESQDAPEKVKKRRFRLSIKEKFEIIDSYAAHLSALARKSSRPESSFTKKDVHKVISKASGVRFGTVAKIFYKENFIRQHYADKFLRKRYTIGSGLKPMFPATEKSLAVTVREKRAKHYTVTMNWLMEEYKKLSLSENKDLAEKAKFGKDLFFAFLLRQKLSRRKPSNIKSMTLLESQKKFRGFIKFLLDLLKGNHIAEVGLSREIDPRWGRFPLDCRLNKDEVPGYFGDPSLSIISIRGESSTKVLMIEGWGDRICTLIIMLTPLGLIKRIGLVFKGEGKRVAADETALYDSLPFIEVFWQKKAWVDSKVELEIVRRLLVPHAKQVKKSYEDRQLPFPGILDVEDNFSAHLNEYIILNLLFMLFIIDSIFPWR
jgi:hypothetical protein